MCAHPRIISQPKSHTAEKTVNNNKEEGARAKRRERVYEIRVNGNCRFITKLRGGKRIQK